jgi:hypothetical protein
MTVLHFGIQYTIYSGRLSSNTYIIYDWEHILKYKDLGKDFEGVLKDVLLFAGKITG